MKHILFYTDCPGIYGTEQCNHTLSEFFIKTGYQVSFVQHLAKNHLIEQRNALGVSNYWLKPDSLYDLTKIPKMLTDKEEPTNIFLQAKPDLILFSDGAPFSNLKAKEAAIDLAIPYIIVNHCVNPEWAKTYKKWLPELAIVYQNAKAVIAVSQANLTLLRSSFGLEIDKGQVIFNGRPEIYFKDKDPTKRKQIRASLNIPKEGIVFLTVGRIESVKGYLHQCKTLLSLREFIQRNNIYFLWVGEGTLISKLQHFVNRFRLSNHVQLLGKRTDVPDLLDATDVFLLPSEYEGMPLSLMEAMAKSLPLISTVVSGIPEAVGDAGILLPSPTEQSIDKELKEAILKLLENEDLRYEYGVRGRKRAEKYFRIADMHANYLKLVRKIFAEQKESPVGNKHNSYPKISCLTITKGNIPLLKRALYCLQQQSYPNIELVLVTDSNTENIEELKALLKDLTIETKYVHCEDSNIKLGGLRNLAIKNASGTLVCQWDDDDEYHPNRLMIQYQFLKSHNADVCVLGDQLQIIQNKKLIAWSSWSKRLQGHPLDKLIPGTILMYRDTTLRYPPNVPKGEDTFFIRLLFLRKKKMVLLQNRGYLYLYQHHGNNTWDEEHHTSLFNYTKASYQFIEPNLAPLKNALAFYDLDQTYQFQMAEQAVPLLEI